MQSWSVQTGPTGSSLENPRPSELKQSNSASLGIVWTHIDDFSGQIKIFKKIFFRELGCNSLKFINKSEALDSDSSIANKTFPQIWRF